MFPLKAADFIQRGSTRGPRSARRIAAAEEAWIKAECPLDAAALSAIVEARIAGKN